MARIVFASVLGLTLLFQAGCGEEGYGLANAVKLTGTVTDGGTPLHVEGLENATGMITVGFCPIEGDGKGQARVEATSAMVAADGTFEVVDGIQPGTYLITVRAWEPYPQIDKLKGKFSEQRSKIIREIAGDTELEIDVSNPEG